MVMKERMMTGLMKLTLSYVPLRERYIAGWEKLYIKPTQQNHLQEAVRVFQIQEVGTPEYQSVHIDQGHQRTQNLKGKRDRRMSEVSWVDGWSFTHAGKINDPE